MAAQLLTISNFYYRRAVWCGRMEIALEIDPSLCFAVLCCNARFSLSLSGIGQFMSQTVDALTECVLVDLPRSKSRSQKFIVQKSVSVWQ